MNTLQLRIFTAMRLKHASKKDPEGGDWCRRKQVGPVRAGLAVGEPLPANVVRLMSQSDPRFIEEEATKQDAEILRAFCRACRACPLGEG